MSAVHDHVEDSESHSLAYDRMREPTAWDVAGLAALAAVVALPVLVILVVSRVADGLGCLVRRPG